MTNNAYHFITSWRVKGTVKEVADILNDAADLARWWPSVYLDVKVLKPGDEHSLGRVVSLYTKGWLPYTLRWDFRVTDVQANGFTLQAWGDFDGRGIWAFEQDGPDVNITYDWKINAEKPLLRYFSFIMKPIFSANHRWAMKQGEKSLKLELARRHATTEAECAQILTPPQATMFSSFPLLLGMVGVAAIAGVLGYWVVRRRDAYIADRSVTLLSFLPPCSQIPTLERGSYRALPSSWPIRCKH